MADLTDEALDGLAARLRAAKQYDKRRAADTITALRKRVAELERKLDAAHQIERNVQSVREHEFRRAEAAEAKLAALEAGSVQAAAKVLLNRSLLALRDTTRNMSGQDVFACDGEYFTVAGLQESIERALSGEPT